MVKFIAVQIEIELDSFYSACLVAIEFTLPKLGC